MSFRNTFQNSRPSPGPRVRNILTALLLAFQLLPAALSHADTSADSLLKRVEETWKSSQTFTAEFIATTTYPTYYRDSQEKGTITLARPDHVSIRLDRYRKLERGNKWEAMGNVWTNVSDGKTYWTLWEHPNSAQYRKTIPPAASDKLLESVELLKGFFSGNVQHGEDDRLLGSEKWEGADYQIVETRSKGGKVITQLYIGEDGLIHRLLAQNNEPDKAVHREVTLRNIRINDEISSSAFSVVLPDGAHPFERTKSQPLLNAGEESPDFTVQDAAGKSIRLSELRGKVVVLKFFATWCGSCRQSLSHTEDVVRQFDRNKVITLAVDIWDSEKGLRSWKHKYESIFPDLLFAIGTAPQGQDIATTLYHVSTTPTLFIIGADGKIIKSLTGYEGPTTELKEAIEAGL